MAIGYSVLPVTLGVSEWWTVEKDESHLPCFASVSNAICDNLA